MSPCVWTKRLSSVPPDVVPALRCSLFGGRRMEFEDFKRNYDRVEICNMTPDALTDSTKRHWEVNMFEGNWIRGSTAGGCRNFIGEVVG